MTARKVGREWTLHNDLHPADIAFSLRGTNDSLKIVMECLVHNQSITVDLDTSTAIQIATELFGRVGMADALLDSLIRHAVALLREQDPEALKRFMAQLGEKVVDEPGD